MRREVMAALNTLLAIGLTLVAAVAAARTTGKQSFRGVIVASGESGTRTVVSTLIVARGVLKGNGRVVEVANRRGDPDNVSRDDLVFPRGRLHLVTTNKSFTPSVNPQTCANTVRIRAASAACVASQSALPRARSARPSETRDLGARPASRSRRKASRSHHPQG